MEDFELITKDISELNLNLFDFAIYSDEGLFEHFFLPCNPCNDSYSVAKAFVMTAVGLLYDDGKLSPDDRITDVLSDFVPDGIDALWHDMTLAHALTHRVGLPAGSLDIDADDASAYPSDDYLAMLFSQKLTCPPGTKYAYTDAAFYLLARVIEHACGKPVDQLLRERVLGAMGFREIAWSRCPLGHPMGATGLYARASDIVKLAWLYLNGGVYRGKRLISAEWVRLALDNGYELHKMSPGGLIGKGGMRGQGIAFSQKGRFAVAWHAFEESGTGRLTEYLDTLA